MEVFKYNHRFPGENKNKREVESPSVIIVRSEPKMVHIESGLALTCASLAFLGLYGSSAFI